ncbi:helix-turn-helix domain-containing protein [Streptomyces sp. PmtA]|uniref:helix-turn-helix domain-containing protein n=1 Tax=Streptomyces sp. PmtA TaxID=3074275 RepID=UPI0030156F28
MERHGYLERRRERLPDGTWTTVTYAYNNPAATSARRAREAAADAVREVGPGPVPKPGRAPRPPVPKPSTPPPPPVRATAPARVRAVPASPRRPPLPTPSAHAPAALHRSAADLLAGLREREPRLALSERDVRRLAPAVAAWLERGVRPDAVRHALTGGLPPEPLHHPAGLLAHRLTALLPAPLPTTSARPSVDPLQNCDRCDRAFRAPEPGRCGGCAGVVRRPIPHGGRLA